MFEEMTYNHGKKKLAGKRERHRKSQNFECPLVALK